MVYNTTFEYSFESNKNYHLNGEIFHSFTVHGAYQLIDILYFTLLYSGSHTFHTHVIDGFINLNECEESFETIENAYVYLYTYISVGLPPSLLSLGQMQTLPTLNLNKSQVLLSMGK